MGCRRAVTALGAGLLATVGAAAAVTAQPASSDRLYGKVLTAAGKSYEGYMVWDLSEASWSDLLDAYKEIPLENVEDAERLGAIAPEDRERAIEFMGYRIIWEEELDYPRRTDAGVRFGQLRSLRVLDDDRVRVTTKGGLEVDLDARGTDLGVAFRGVVVEDPDQGAVELGWKDLDRVEWSAPPAGAVPSERRRLYGTVRDGTGARYTGYVVWDLDETFEDQRLQGEGGDGRHHEIAFDRIERIERVGTSGSRVTLAGGEELHLTGSNDVDDDNRGIRISDPELGQVEMEWSEFESFRRHPPAEVWSYGTFDGGRRLRGTVLKESGEVVEGLLRWDNDEEYTWEILDGEAGDVAYRIEFGRVARIERATERSSRVTLRDGRTFELEGSNDVDGENKGIFVETGAGLAYVAWDEVREVRFE